MATKWEKTTVFDLTADKLLETLTNPEFQAAQRMNDSAVVDARYQEVARKGDHLIFEVRATEYERGLTGLNKKKTLESVTRNDWDLQQKTSTWVYSSPATGKVSIDGYSRIEPEGDKSKLVAGFTIDVRIPLVGKKVEQAISSGMIEGRAKYDDTIREYAKKLS